MIRACIFDLDGVIVDTASYHYLAWKRLAATLGFAFSEQQNERLKGVSRMESLNILLEEGNIHIPEADKKVLAEQKNTWYAEYISQLTPAAVLPGVTDFLHELKQHGKKIALGSASKNAGMILDKLQIADLFDAVVDGTKTTKAKPDPEIFLLAAKILGVSPAACVVFEDAEAGVEAAARAAMTSVGVGNSDILKKAAWVIPNFNASAALEQVKKFLYE